MENNRILIVDDNESIHEDFRKILLVEQYQDEKKYNDLEEELFGSSSISVVTDKKISYEISFAFQGEQALEMVEQAEYNQLPYALIFMDVRMPPGWDGIETISKIWDKYPNIEIVVCSAYSDYSWEKIISQLGTNDRLLFLKKPFEPIEVQQMALALVKKWNLSEKAKNYVFDLEKEVAKRTKQLKGMVHELMNSRDKLKQEIFIRKQAEQALESEKENLSVTLKSLNEGVITTDINGNVVLVNRKAEELLSEPQENILGKPLQDFLPLKDEDTKQPFNLVLSDFNELAEKNNLLMSGSEISMYVNLMVSPIKDKALRLIGYVIVLRDITEKRKLEKEILKTKKLDSIATFAGSIAYEFNNIINELRTSLNLARKEASLADSHKYLEAAFLDVIKAGSIAEQLMKFSQKGEIERQNFDLDTLIKESIDLNSLEQQNIEVDINLDPFISLNANRNELLQVFNTMILNILKKETDSLKISAKIHKLVSNNSYQLLEGHYVEVVFSNSQLVLESDTLAKIFDPYFDISDNQNNLSLYSVYSIIKKHNGSILVESDKSKGTQFIINLPVDKAEEISKVKVLISDDDEKVCQILERVLVELDYQVTTINSDILSNLRDNNNDFKVIILDFKLISSLKDEDYILKLKQIDPNIKVVISSSFSSNEMFSNNNLKGADSFITKPFRVKELAQTLKELLI